MRAVEARWDLDGLRLAAGTQEAGLLRGLEDLVGAPTEAEPESGPQIRLDFARGAPDPFAAPGAQILYQGDLPGAGPCLFQRAGALRHVGLAERASLFLDLPARRGEIRLAPGAPRALADALLPLALEFLLDAEGRQILHAAGLSLPGEGRMILLCAPSGTGKTTTALALARGGLGFASDDAVALREGPEGLLQAWGLPRAVKIHRRTAQFLPWLAGLAPQDPQSAAQEEQAAPRAALAGAFALETRSLPLSDILLLRRREGERTAMRPLNKAEALAALAADNLRGSAAGLPGLHARRYALLAQAARQARVWELRLGPEPEAARAAALRALGVGEDAGGPR